MKQGGWFHTDNIGYMTESGEIFILGRQSDLISISNARVAPEVVEAMIEKHPKVQAVAIVPIPDEITFQQLCACIVPINKSDDVWQDIVDFLHKVIHHSHSDSQLSDLIPKYHVLLDSIPMTIHGKVEKEKLTEQAIKLLNVS